MDTDKKLLLAYQGVRVVVTGASGFIGRWVASLLSQVGADLWLIARDPKGLSRVCDLFSIQGQYMHLDLEKPLAFREAYAKLRPAITFNCIGYGIDQSERDENLSYAINARLVYEMAETIAMKEGPAWGGLRIVQVGSAFEYGPIQAIISEESAPVPQTVYGKSKLAGTRHLQTLCEQTGLRAVTARVFTVYGPGEHSTRLLPSILRSAKTGEPLDLTGGKQQRDFTFVKDVAEGLLRLGLVAEVPRQVVNLATGKLTSVRDFLECACRLLGVNPNQMRFGAIPYREDELWQYQADVSRLEHVLKWRPMCTVSEGIKQTITFELSHETGPPLC